MDGALLSRPAAASLASTRSRRFTEMVPLDLYVVLTVADLRSHAAALELARPSAHLPG